MEQVPVPRYEVPEQGKVHYHPRAHHRASTGELPRGVNNMPEPTCDGCRIINICPDRGHPGSHPSCKILSNAGQEQDLNKKGMGLNSLVVPPDPLGTPRSTKFVCNVCGGKVRQCRNWPYRIEFWEHVDPRIICPTISANHRYTIPKALRRRWYGWDLDSTLPFEEDD